MRIRGAIMLATALALLAPAAAQGADFEVTSGADAGAGTLRAAIEAANAASPPAGEAFEIDFAAAIGGLIELETALPQISGAPVALAGPGAGELTIRRAAGADPFQLFHVPGGRSLAISGLTLSGGSAPASPSSGGAIFNAGELALDGVVLTGNRAGGGGALNNLASGVVTIRDSRFEDNEADASGGAIGNGGQVTIERSTIEANVAGASGGGINNSGGALVVIDSTVAGNEANGAASGYGGGIYSFQGSGANQVSVVNSTIAENVAQLAGGGIYQQSTLAAAQLGLSSATLAANEAPAGANLAMAPGTVAQAASTIIADPLGAASCEGSLISLGWNLDAGTSCGLDGPADQTGSDPLLSPLADNGGPTETMALAPESPAVDQGYASARPTDQRGLPRGVDFPIGNALTGDDVGAFELQEDELPPDHAWPLPSNAFSFGKLARKPRRGTARLAVAVPGAGELVLLRTAQVKRARRQVASGRTVRLLVAARGKAKRKLERRGSVRVSARVRYRPDGGQPRIKRKRVKLVRR